MLKKILFAFVFIYMISSVYSVDISSCQTISSAGDYILTQNLSNTSTCITITTSNVNLNCNGYTISGDGGASDYGIKIDGEAYDYNNISNCNLSNFGYGVYLGYGDYNKFENLSVTSSQNWLNLNNNAEENIFKNIIFDKRFTLGNIPFQMNYFDNVSDGNGKYVMSFNNSGSIDIDGWTNISTIYVASRSSGSCSIKNLNSDGLDDRGFFILFLTVDYCNLENLNISNYSYGFYSRSVTYNNFSNSYFSSNTNAIELGNSRNNSLNNMTIIQNNNGLRIMYSTCNNNLINNSYIINNTNDYLTDYCINNLISNSQIGSIITNPTSQYCNNIYQNVTDGYGNYLLYSNQSVNINGWTNTSSIILCNAPNSNISNINFNGITKTTSFIKSFLSNNTIYSNLNLSNYYTGIYVQYGDNNLFTNINTSNNSQNGIHTYYSNNNSFTNITTYSNNNYGLYMVSSNYNTLSNLNSYNNTNYGFYIWSSSNNSINNLSTYYNGQYGIYFNNAARNNFSNFSTYNNSQYGIYLSSSSNNNFNNFNSSNNSQHGIYLSGSSNNSLSNFNSHNNLLRGLEIQGGQYNLFNNFSSYSNNDGGVGIQSSNWNNFNNFSIYNILGSYGTLFIYYSNGNNISNLNMFGTMPAGLKIMYNSDNNLISNSSILSSSSNIKTISFEQNGVNTPQNNTFYNNYLENSSRLSSDNWSNINYFNYTLPSGLVIGNYWNNLSCSSYTINGSYEICTNPANYTINSTNNIYDFAPLVYPAVIVNYTTGPSGNYYSESIYIEVNATKNISSCILYFNGTPSVMSVNNNLCYTTASGSFGNSYDYNVTVNAVNTAVNTTITNTINLLDVSINYVSPPTPLNNVKKYALENITIQISDNGGSFDNCIVQIEDVNYSMTYSGGNCSYTYTIPDFNRTTSVTFQGFYNVSGTVSALEERTVTIYESQTNQNKIPAFGLNSIILFILTIIGGIIFS